VSRVGKKTQKKESMGKLGLELVEDIEQSWNLNRFYIVTLIADLISSIVILYTVFVLHNLPYELFWTILFTSIKPYFSTALFLISRTQKAKMVNIITKLLDEAIKIRDGVEWKIELAAVKPESVGRLKESMEGVSIWNSSNEKIALMEKIKQMENEIKILKQPKEVIT
jgi:hypothetical protein